MQPIPPALLESLAERYTVERELGQGGMATVYLARDQKHDRLVALKVLRPELTALLGAERFLQEIQVTANLQHPHILPLHDSGSAAGLLFYVMPYVPGESLRSRLTREKQLGVDEALRLTTQVASALDYAHRQGVLHRDIKPENVLLHDGQALLADFGIALALRQAGGNRLTETGLSLGTPQYMSPEQATGDRQLDARSDVYSLACVLYEMLTGEPPHTGPTVQAVIARLVTEEPRPISGQRRAVPAHVEAAVLQALEKLPADRFTSARQFADALSGGTVRTTRAVRPTGSGTDRRRSATAVAVGGVTCALTALALWGWLRPQESPPVIRYRSSHLAGEEFVPWNQGNNVVLSADGKRLAYTGPSDSAERQLWLRDRSQLQANPLPGTHDGSRPVFSPDGGQIAFLRRSTLNVVALDGSLPTTVVDSGVDAGGLAWGEDGFIYFMTARGIERVRPTGGEAELTFPIDSAGGERGQAWPEALPDGRGLVYRSRSGPQLSDSRIVLGDLESRRRRVLLPGIYARYAASGHLLVVTADGKLVAAPFDRKRQSIAGATVLLAEGLVVKAFGAVDLAISRSGTLVYQWNPPSASLRSGVPVWVAQGGGETEVAKEWTVSLAPTEGLALSPDGRWLALAIPAGRASRADIWTKDLTGGPLSRLTTTRRNGAPFWTPDGSSVGFVSFRSVPPSLMHMASDGSTPEGSLLTLSDPISRARWTADARWLVYERTRTTFNIVHRDIEAVRPGVDSAPRGLLVSEANEGDPVVSPDGRWLAYESNESGRYEVYVKPFASVGSRRWQVSLQGGSSPRWGPGGRALFYAAPDGEILRATAAAQDSVFAVSSRTVFVPTSTGGNRYYEDYDVHPDGQRLLMVRLAASEATEVPSLVVVENFLEELKRKVPR